MAAPHTFRTVCPRNCYCTCGMVVTVEDGRITAIAGDPENSATRGQVCLKGLSYARRVDAADRLLHPLRRRADGWLERVSWEAALDLIAERLVRVRAESGPLAACYLEGSGSHGALGALAHAFWRQYGGCTLPHGDLCWPAGLEATRLTYGDNRHSHPRCTAESRFVLIWGHNPAETNVHQMRWLLDAQERGATLAVVDPRSTDTSDAADLHLRPRPGSDAALALGMARAIFDAGLEDRDFLAAHAHGVEAFRRRLEAWPLARAAAVTGLPEAAIAELAHAFARAEPALLIAGFGVQRHAHAGQTVRAIALLPALTGDVGRAGGGFQYANLASHCLRPLPLPPVPAGGARSFPISRLGRALLDLDQPPVRAVWIEKSNPVSQSPRAGLVREALARLELVVVVDQFVTDTARLADVVLPAKTMFEEEDLVTAYWHPYVSRRAKIFEPPGEVKTETEIWRLLCERLGFDTSWFPRGDPSELLRGLLPEGSEDLFDELARRPLDLSSNGEVAWADRRFLTPSGRIELASDEAAALWGVDAVPDWLPLPEADDEERARRWPLQLLSCKTRERIHSQFGNLPWVREVARPHRLDLHPDDARARGLAEGDRATVWNDRGRLEIVVRLDHGLRPGVAQIHEGRCSDDDPEVNLLTADGVTDMGHGATFYDCRVEVARA